MKFLIAAAALTATLSLAAQTPTTPRASAPPTAPEDLAVVSHVPGITILNTPNAPFSAREAGEWTMLLQDGSKDTRTYFSMVARDSQGRIYRERRGLVPTGSPHPSPLLDFSIQDPIAGTRIVCMPAHHQCTAYPYKAVLSTATPHPGSYDQGSRTVAIADLGSSTVDDLTATGIRETTTFQPGAVGNEKVVSYTRELWFSPDLNLNLSVQRQDPRTGTQLIRLTELSRIEPPLNRFTVPSDYTIMDSVNPAIRGTASARTTSTPMQ